MSNFLVECFTAPLLLAATPRATLVALLVWALIKVARVRDPAKSHTLWAAVLCGMLAYQLIALAVPPVSVPVWDDFTRSAEGPAQVAPWLRAAAALYLAGVAVMLLRLGRDLRAARKLVRCGEPVADARVDECLAELATRLASRRRPSMWTSPAVRVPLTLGYLMPKIFLPPGWRQWDESKLKSVLAHEFAHAQRGDYLVQLLGVVNQCVYWFNPLSWLLQKRISLMAEQACDAAAVRFTGDGRQYAMHLVEVASEVEAGHGRLVPSGLTMARTTQIHSRVEAILEADDSPPRRYGPLRKLCVVLSALVLWAFVASLCFSR